MIRILFRVRSRALGVYLLILTFVSGHSGGYAEDGGICNIFANSNVVSITASYRCAIGYVNMSEIDLRSRVLIPRDLLPLELPKNKEEWILARHERFTRDRSTLKRIVDYTGRGRNKSEENLIAAAPGEYSYPFREKRLMKNEDYDMLRDEILGMEWMPSTPPFNAMNAATSTLTLPVNAGNSIKSADLGSYTYIEKVWPDGMESVNGERCRALKYEISVRVPEYLSNSMHEDQFRNKPGGPIYKNFLKVIVKGRVLWSEVNGIVYSHKSEQSRSIETMERAALKKNPKAKPKETSLLAKKSCSYFLTSYKVEYK